MPKLRLAGLAFIAWASLISAAPLSEAREAERTSHARVQQVQATQRIPAVRGRPQTSRRAVPMRNQVRSHARAPSKPRAGVRAAGNRRAAAAAPRHGAQAGRSAARHQQARRQVQRGRASYYASRFHGQRMANGQPFDQHSSSAASRTLPLGSRAQVRNLDNGRTAEVVIDDRGPHSRSRVMDVSPAVAGRLGMRQSGTARVEIVPLVSSAVAAERKRD